MTQPIQIVCSQCEAINRLAADKLEMTVNCGKCKRPLLAGSVKPLNGKQFSKYMNSNDLPVVVDFWAPWCGPCKMMAPHFEKAAKELRTSVRFAKVNTEQEQALAGRFDIRSIPTLAVFKNGKEIARQSGAMDANNLKRWIASVTR